MSMDTSKNSNHMINAVRIIGTHHSIPFCCVVNDSTIVYLSERRLIMENIKTHQQSTIWVNDFDDEIEAIAKVNCYNDTKIAIGLRETLKKKKCIIVLQIDWGGYMLRKEKQSIIYLEKIDQSELIKEIQFSINGDDLCIMATFEKHYILTFLNCDQNEEEKNKEIYEQMKNLKGIRITTYPYFCYFHQQQLVILSKGTCYVEQKMREKIPFLEANEQIIKLQFEQSKKNDTIGFVLTSFGHFIIFKTLQISLEGCSKLDLRINPFTMSFNYLSEAEEKKPQKFIVPECFGHSSNRIVIGYRNTRKVAYISYSILNHPSYTISLTQNILHYPSEYLDEDSIEEKTIVPRKVQISLDSCTCCLIVENSDRKFYVMVIDTFTSLIVNEKKKKQNYSSKIFGNYSAHGKIISSSYAQLDTILMILHESDQDSMLQLSCYFLNYLNLLKETPKKLLKWKQSIKTKPFQVHVHPCNFSLMLIHEDLVKFHNYTQYKMFQSFSSINLQKCECGCFSPLGDKVVLGSQNKILVIDFYTMEIYKILNPNILNKRTLKQLEYISPFDLLVEFGSGSGNYLSILKNYNEFSVLNQKHSVNLQNGNLSLQRCQMLNQNQNASTFQLDEKNQHMIIAEKGSNYKIYNNENKVIVRKNIPISSMKLFPTVGILLIGTVNGKLIAEKWPKTDDSANDENYSINLHASSIISINITLNFRYLITISQNGEICMSQFAPQNSGMINKASSLYLLKKWANKMSMASICLSSLEEENKRNENITKAIGKEVFIMKKNEEKVKKIEGEMEQNFSQDIIKLEERIKEELQNCEQEKERKIMIRKIERIKNERIKEEEGRKKEIREMEEEHQSTLNKIFRQRESLELELAILLQKCKKYKKVEKSQLEEERKKEGFFRTLQQKEFQNNLKTNKNQERKRNQINEGLQIEMKQDKIENQIQIYSQFDSMLEKLLSKQNKLKHDERKYQGSIAINKQKISQISLSKMELISELEVLREKHEISQKNVKNLREKLADIDVLHEKFIKKERKQESVFKEVKKQAVIVQDKYNELQAQIDAQIDHYNSLEQKKYKIDDQFWIQHEKKKNLTEALEQAEKKIEHLKKVRQTMKTRNVILKRKNRNSAVHKQHFSNPHTNDKRCSQMKEMMEKRQNIIQVTNKMNRIKNQRIKQFKVYEKRLGNDSKKLVSQYNELKTYNDYLHKKEMMTRNKIRNYQESKKGRRTMMKAQIKKGVFISFHDGQNKFITQL